MNLSEIFGKEFTLSGFTLVITAAIVFFVVISAAGYVMSLRRKLKNATTPKFGFAGKPLYQFLAVLFLAASLPLGYVAIQQQIHFEQMAEEKVDVVMEYRVVSIEGDKVTLEFSVIPYVDGAAWGNKSYDIFWSFEGEETERLFEFGKNVNSPSNLLVTLTRGRYNVRATVSYDSKSVETVEEIVID